MKVIFAPDKFKGSCPADKAAEAMARGWKGIFPGDEAVLMPVADGGDGTLAAMHAACGGQYITVGVQGPMGDTIQEKWLLLDDGTAVIEMALASGLGLVAESQRDVRRADTFGTGQLISDALDRGCRRFIVGIGGSATNDGGIGMLRALGVKFLSAKDELIAPGDLITLEQIDFSGFDLRLAECSITIASDVSNPLCGANGASAVYGPQKGATASDVAHMDMCLKKLSEVAAAQMGFDRSESPGAGAAGGVGWALMQCCGASMRPGIELVLDAAGFDKMLSGAGLVVTGEGSVDGQTAMGKALSGIAGRAQDSGVPVAVIAGSLGRGHEAIFDIGMDCALSIVPGPMPLHEAMERAEQLLEDAAARLARAILLGQRLGRQK